MSFWSGSRMETIWHALGPGVNQAHNGYLEQYLNLGYVGVAFIVMILLVAFVKIYGHLRWQPSYAMLRLCFVVSAALYNYTEASFYGMNNMWLLLLLSSTDISAQHLRRIRIERRVLARAPSIT
jgi:O-antigen ligase